jgi:tRNA-(ms[2]io[6]A)-hydroxylase
MLCLKAATDDAWCQAAMGDLDRVLIDHAHCELKAAANALSLAARHPDDLRLVQKLTDIAQEEIAHFQRVLSTLVARGLPLGTPAVDVYAADLRTAAKRLARPVGVSALVDRLLVAALIEARSCERFKQLARALREARPEESALVAFYDELFAAEALHYRVFVDLAEQAAEADVTEAARGTVGVRLEALAVAEAQIIERLAQNAAPGARAAIHG